MADCEADCQELLKLHAINKNDLWNTLRLIQRPEYQIAESCDEMYQYDVQKISNNISLHNRHFFFLNTKLNHSRCSESDKCCRVMEV